MAKKLDTPTLAALSAMQFDGNLARITGQLDRKLYVAVNAALEAAGGKWTRGAKAHVFDRDAAEAIEPMLLTGEYTTHRDFGFFETPPEIGARLIQWADPHEDHQVLEPSAGRGALVRLIAPHVRLVDCVELQPANADVLRAEFSMPGVAVVCADFLAAGPGEWDAIPARQYDRIIMNPPFSPPRGADVQHVTHALRFLRPGGVLVSIMSSSVTFRQDRAAVQFRELMERYNGSVEVLSAGAFKISGTSVNTVAVRLAAPA